MCHYLQTEGDFFTIRRFYRAILQAFPKNLFNYLREAYWPILLGYFFSLYTSNLSYNVFIKRDRYSFNHLTSSSLVMVIANHLYLSVSDLNKPKTVVSNLVSRQIQNENLLGIFTKYSRKFMTPEKKILPCPRCQTPNSVEVVNGVVPKGLKCINCKALIS